MTLGIIGGSGIYGMEKLTLVKQHTVNTPFGEPSGPISECELDGQKLFFLPRHGIGHHLTPAEVPYRANIFALKTLGVKQILAVSAVGIMKEEITPGDMVIPDQIFDRTKGVRPSTFFGRGVVGHVSFADPFCSAFSLALKNAAEESGAKLHYGGSYVCMEGPAFSTRSESHFYRDTIKPSIIGMTGIPEAKLAREAEMCYSMLATATDYDCWHETEEDVNVEAVVQVLKDNKATAQNIVISLIQKHLANKTQCACHESAKFAIMTSPDSISKEAKERLGDLYGKYWS